MKHKLGIQILTVLFVAGTILSANRPAFSADLAGSVQGAGQPIAGATVTVYAAGAGAPTQLAQGKTNDDGVFKLDVKDPPGSSVVYVVAKGGTPKAAVDKRANDSIALMTVVGSKVPNKVTINELTTVASAYTNARFITGESISGNLLGLRIAAGNVPNLVDPQTGTWGKVLLDPINSTQTTTLANLDTLGSLITACFTVANDDWRARFFEAATPPSGVTPKNTLEAMAGIARAPWTRPKALYALFDEAYPQPKDGSRRSAPFVPYLAYVPDDFALMLCFAGGGYYAGGKLLFDADGNLWSGQNWMPGSQSGVINSIGGGVVKFTPNGRPLSPPITGFTGMGIDGIGWGTGVTRDHVWVSSFNGKICVLDFNGKPVAKEGDLPFKEKLFGLMGIGVAANGDVWIADGPGNQLLYFPGGRIKDGRIVKVKGLMSPFGIAIDAQNRVWVSNSAADTLLRFPADDPSKVESFRLGLSVRGVALDSKGNLWVTSNMSQDFPKPEIPPGASIMEQFKLLTAHMMKTLLSNPKMTTGVVNMIRPDGTQPAPEGFTGNKLINVPWGVSIDGNDDVWVGTTFSRCVVLLAGENTEGHPPGTKPGDLIHVFRSGNIQILTDAIIDPAGNVWAANNWNNLDAVASPNPYRPTSTWGGGSGFNVIYGVAAPVKPPLMGQVRKY
jgi:hypothetical protein